MAIIDVPTTPISGGTFDFSPDANFVATQLSDSRILIANLQRNPYRILSRIVDFDISGNPTFRTNWAINGTQRISALCLRTITSSKILFSTFRKVINDSRAEFFIVNVDSTGETLTRGPVTVYGDTTISSKTINPYGVVLHNTNRNYGLYVYNVGTTTLSPKITRFTIDSSDNIYVDPPVLRTGTFFDDTSTIMILPEYNPFWDTLFVFRDSYIIKVSVNGWFSGGLSFSETSYNFTDVIANFEQFTETTYGNVPFIIEYTSAKILINTFVRTLSFSQNRDYIIEFDISEQNLQNLRFLYTEILPDAVETGRSGLLINNQFLTTVLKTHYYNNSVSAMSFIDNLRFKINNYDNDKYICLNLKTFILDNYVRYNTIINRNNSKWYNDVNKNMFFIQNKYIVYFYKTDSNYKLAKIKLF